MKLEDLKLPFGEDLFLKINSQLIDGAFTPSKLSINPGGSKFITGARYYGNYNDLDLHILTVVHSGSEDARVGVSLDIFKLMKKYSFQHALVAAHSINSDTWRYSLITSNLSINDKGKVIKEFSNPRRYSFVLGPNQKVTTPYKQLIESGRARDIKELSKRFSLEVVNNEFYKEIARLYDELVGTDKITRRLTYPSDGDDSQEFAVRLVGRIIFCWFLREKKSKAGVALIPANVLSREASNLSSYYHAVLAPLFFEVLNRPILKRANKYKSGEYASIPYLNGGLFNNDNIDHFKFDKSLEQSIVDSVNVPDSWLHELFDLLERFNFTVDENTSYDTDLSIDPEMLGRVFENLLARINPDTGEAVRKSTGSFYTPREIVEYMVDTSLSEYLCTKTSLDKSKIDALISYNNFDNSPDQLQTEEKISILEALSKLTVLDPACGSGAFPIGMLQKIVFIISQLDPNAEWWLAKQLEGAGPELRREFAGRSVDYIRKLGVIRQTIFGVDIQPIATEISRLRCFLTLIVDEAVDDASNDNRGIRPLPNLDFKFVTANSIVPIPEQKNIVGEIQQDMFDNSQSERIERLRLLRNEYFDAHLSERSELKAEFRLVQNELWAAMHNTSSFGQQSLALSGWDPFSSKATDWFDTEWMFGINNGFDIVIANPPYVSEKGRKDMFRNLALSDFGARYYKGKMDLFYFFIHAGLDFLKEEGTLCFITTNYYLTATNADKLRADYQKRATLVKLVNFHELKIFESALGQHNLITVIAKGKFNILCKTAITNHKGYLKNTQQVLAQILSGTDEETEYYQKPQADMFNSRGFIDLRDSPTSNLMEKLSLEHPKLKKYFEVSEGLQTGNNKVFVFDTLPPFYGQLSQNEKDYFKPFYKNSDVEQYYTNNPNSKYVLYIDKKFQLVNNPKLAAYLNAHRDELADRAQIKRSKQEWYTLLWPRSREMFTGLKIVFPYRAKVNVFSLIDSEWYSGTDTYIIYNGKRSLILCLAILNSKLALCWLKNKGAVKGDVLELKGDVIMDFPIPTFDHSKSEIESNIISLTDKIIAEKKEGSTKLSQDMMLKIDKYVYELYDLKPNEIDILEASN